MRKIMTFTDRSNMLLMDYLCDIRKYRLIDEAKEQELARRIAKGDNKARNELIIANLRLVVSIAKKFQSSKLEIMNLIEAGNLGLIQAAERFESGRGTRFCTFAIYYIRKEILQTLFGSHNQKVENVAEESYINPFLDREKEEISLEDYAKAEQYWEPDYDCSYSSSYEELRKVIRHSFCRRDAEMLLDYINREGNCLTVTFLALKYHMQDEKCQKLIDEMMAKLHHFCKQTDTYASAFAA